MVYAREDVSHTLNVKGYWLNPRGFEPGPCLKTFVRYSVKTAGVFDWSLPLLETLGVVIMTLFKIRRAQQYIAWYQMF